VPSRAPQLATVYLLIVTLALGGLGEGAKASGVSNPAQETPDVPAPFFWDPSTHQRAGGEADRFELDDPTRTEGQSAWYHLSYIPGGSRLAVHEHSPATTPGPESAIGRSADVAWHVATVVLGRAGGVARPGELPAWARPRTGSGDGSSAGLLFALADVDLTTPGALAGRLRVAATGTIGSDGAVTSVRMVEAKLAAARLIPADVMFAPDFPAGTPGVTVVPSHAGRPAVERAIGDWLNTDGYESAGRAARRSAGLALVSVDDVRQALAWLCGRTANAVACDVAHAAAVPMGSARPYTHTKGIAPDRAGPT
jgi:hypothetical protein